MLAHDIYAESNPAYFTYAIVGFCREYCLINPDGPSLELIYLALAIASSQDMEPSFSSTNSRTGLIAWLSRYPLIRLEIRERVAACRPMATEAIRFSVLTRAIEMVEGGYLKMGERQPVKAAVGKLPEGPKGALKRAERLGHWMAVAGSPSTILSAFGVDL